jgi:hypothetical protein
MAAKKPSKPKKAKDLDIGKTRGGESIKGGAAELKIGTVRLTGKHLR